MDLEGLKEKLKAESGRFDLDALDVGGINKLTRVLNEAQRWLDRQATPRKNSLRKVGNLAAGDISITTRYLRSVEKVWVSGTADDGIDTRIPLKQADLHLLREKYARSDSTDIDQGTPTDYALDVIGLSTEQNDVTDLSSFQDTETILTGDHWNYEGIVFYPPADRVFTISIYGTFWSPELVADADITYWALEPQLLVNVARMLLEGRKRNNAGVRAWREIIDPQIFGLEKDKVAMEISHDQIVPQG